MCRTRSIAPRLTWCVGLGMLLGLIACRMEKIPDGWLVVDAPRAGTYEVYRIGDRDPVALISEEVGHYNQPISLRPGSYLVMADCSAETVIITPGDTERLTAHHVHFIRPPGDVAGGRFSVQCERYAAIGARQKLVDQFHLDLLAGPREMLVGMTPLQLDFSRAGRVSPTDLTYQLAAVVVDDRAATFEQKHGFREHRYFVSPSEESLSLTAAQEFGRPMYLMPGRYIIQASGTSLEVSLSGGHVHRIATGSLRVEIPPEVDMQLASQITGEPAFVEINGRHWLTYNSDYPALPGRNYLTPSGSSARTWVTIEEGKQVVLRPRSLMVDLGCSPWHWDCLGGRDVFLFRPEAAYPFASGLTDVPILFFGRDVWVGIEGSRNLRTRLGAGRAQALQLGEFVIETHPVFRPGQTTDFVRLEGVPPNFAGQSLDFDYGRTTKLQLVAGSYELVHYVSFAGPELDRRRSARMVEVRPGSSTKVDVTVLVTERELAAIVKRRRQSRAREKTARRITASPLRAL